MAPDGPLRSHPHHVKTEKVLCLKIFQMPGYNAPLKLESRSEEKKDEV